MRQFPPYKGHIEVRPSLPLYFFISKKKNRSPNERHVTKGVFAVHGLGQ